MIECCPRESCGSSAIYKRLIERPPWRCDECGHTFEEPVVRERRRGGWYRSTGSEKAPERE